MLITASTDGFGKMLATKLLKLNCKVFITGKTENSVKNTLNELKKIHEKNVHGKAADFTNETEIKNMFSEAVKHFKKIDILIIIPIPIRSKRALGNIDINEWTTNISKTINVVFLLNQLALKHMRGNSIKGKIINVSSYKTKLTNTRIVSGSDILTDNAIEKYSNLLSVETFGDGIAVTTIRLDEDIDANKHFLDFNLKVPKSVKGIVDSLDNISKKLGNDPEKHIPIFMHVIKAPFSEINGKIIGTQTFQDSKDLTKLVSPGYLNLNRDLYDRIEYTKYKKDADYLVKQNPYNSSSKIKKLISNKKFNLSGVNYFTKYDGKLLNVLAKRHSLEKENILVFDTEDESIKKIFEIFVARYQEVISEFPLWTTVMLLSKKYITRMEFCILNHNEKNETIQVDLNQIIKNINSKTKLIYLSSPNTVTGQSIPVKEWDEFIKKIPDNVIVILDQRYYEFSDNKNKLDGSKYINNQKNLNLFVLRSFNNFYGIQNLKLAYMLCKKSLSNYVSKTMVINDIDDFSEALAIEALKDTEYNKSVIERTNKEKKKLMGKFKDKKMKYIPSETNYFLVETEKSRKDMQKALEKDNVILYESIDEYNNYWTLPVSSPIINNKTFNIINYNL